jgi:prophage regulatory protein
METAPMERLPPRIIGWPVLRTMVPYTRQYILKLEKDGRFPRRLEVGANRIGWLLSEVEAWIEARVAARDKRAGPASKHTWMS